MAKPVSLRLVAEEISSLFEGLDSLLRWEPTGSLPQDVERMLGSR
jgi:hypothetical protein